MENKLNGSDGLKDLPLTAFTFTEFRMVESRLV